MFSTQLRGAATMSRPRKSEVWTTDSERALIAFMRERPFTWNQHHYDFQYIEAKRKVFAECAAMLGPPFTWEMVRDRWTNMRTTFASNYRRSTKNEGEAPSPKPTWIYYNDLIFLEPIVAARYAAKSLNGSEQAPNEPLLLKMEEVDIPHSPPESNYEYEMSSPTSENYPRSIDVVSYGADDGKRRQSTASREEDEWDDFGKMVAKILRKMEESEARLVQLEFFKTLASRSNANT